MSTILMATDNLGYLLKNKKIFALRQNTSRESKQNIWLWQDGCPTHSAHILKQFLSEILNKNVILNNGLQDLPTSPQLAFICGVSPKTKYLIFKQPAIQEILV